MPKLKLPDIEKVVAIDIHTHAEEPCGLHGDDGYDDFQEQMADYFKSPNKHPPTVPETAAYYRSKNIAAVISLSTPNARPVFVATIITRCWRSPPTISTS